MMTYHCVRSVFDGVKLVSAEICESRLSEGDCPEDEHKKVNTLDIFKDWFEDLWDAHDYIKQLRREKPKGGSFVPFLHIVTE